MHILLVRYLPVPKVKHDTNTFSRNYPTAHPSRLEYRMCHVLDSGWLAGSGWIFLKFKITPFDFNMFPMWL